MTFPRFPELPDDDPMDSLRLFRVYLVTLANYFSPVALFAAILTIVGLAFVLAWSLLGLDSTLSWASDSVPLAFAVVGIVLTLKRLREQHEGVIIAVLIIVGIAGTVVLHISRVRTDTKIDTVSALQGNIWARINQQGPRLSPQEAELKRRQNVEELLKGEYILSHENISSGLLAGTEPPPSDWMNKRLGELGESWRVAQPILPQRAAIVTPCIPGRPRINAGPDGYKGVCDEDLAKWVIEEANKIGDGADKCALDLDNAPKLPDFDPTSSYESIRWRFRIAYEGCCLREVKQLRNEATARLGPANTIRQEQALFQELYPEEASSLQEEPPEMLTQTLAVMKANNKVDCKVVKSYAPYLRRLGLKLKRRVVPRNAPKPLHFSEVNIPVPSQIAAFGVVKTGILVTIETKAILLEGYIVIEFGGGLSMGGGGSNLPHSQNDDSFFYEVANKPLNDYLTSFADRGMRNVIEIGSVPFSPEKALRVSAYGTGSSFHVDKVTWFDY